MVDAEARERRLLPVMQLEVQAGDQLIPLYLFKVRLTTRGLLRVYAHKLTCNQLPAKTLNPLNPINTQNPTNPNTSKP